jgi:hypothetical protein
VSPADRYNEQTRLTASLINLLAVGFFTAGVTTPLASTFYGIQVWTGAPPESLAFGVLFWLAMASVMHIVALMVLRRLL